MSFKAINGTPFHITTIKSNDEKRNKSRCIYFRHTKGKDGDCQAKNCRCTGSSQCDDYKEAKDTPEKAKNEINRTLNNKITAPRQPLKTPTTKEILVGEKVLSPAKKTGEIIDVQEKILYVKMTDGEFNDKIHKIGFSAFKNPSVGRWIAVDETIQKYILYLLAK